MARRLPPWAWAILVREFGPKHAPTRLVLFTLPTWMDKTGENCFPTMESLAKATQLSLRAVKAAIDRARREVWIAASKVPGVRSQYPHNYYVACIPDWLNLEAFDGRRSPDVSTHRKFEALSDTWTAQWGGAEDDLHGRPRHPAKPRAGTKLSAPDDTDRVHLIPEPSAPDDINLVHTVHSNSESNSPINSPKKKVTRTSAMTSPVRDMGNRTKKAGTKPHRKAATTNHRDSSSLVSEVWQEANKPEPTPTRQLTAEAGLKFIDALLAQGTDPIEAWQAAQRNQYPVTRDMLCDHLVRRSAA